MRVLQPGKGIAKTSDDVWCLIVPGTGKEGTRTTVVGPYSGLAGFTRVSQDAMLWCSREQPAFIARMMPPDEYERFLAEGDRVQYGYACKTGVETG